MTVARILPPVGDEHLITHLRELHRETWPANLERFSAFALADDPPGKAYVAVAWQPNSRTLHAQAITLGDSPPRCRMPTSFTIEDEWLTRVVPAPRPIRPRFMQPPVEELQESMRAGMRERLALVNALLMIDTTGLGQEAYYIVNDYIFWDPQIRTERIKQMVQQLGANAGLRPFLLKLLTKYMWYGGGEHSMLTLTPLQGGPGKIRLAPAMKPGALSLEEQLNRARARVNGVEFKRGKRFDSKDLKQMTEVLTKEWAEQGVSLATTLERLNKKFYSKGRSKQALSYGQLHYHHKRIVQKHKLLEKRLGRVATAQYVDSRTGSSSDLTQGALEILDVDGFRPKIPVGALVNGKMEPMDICVVIGVSRLSGGVRGYEISLKGEVKEAYLRCIIASILPIANDRAALLGLTPLPGILAGNIDGVFVDNGPGKAKDVRTSVEQLGGIMFNPPGARGDLKGMGERLNRTMIYLMAQETQKGYTRDKSLLETIKRRLRRNTKPMALDDFERLLLKAINHVNTTYSKRKLRSAAMRSAKTGITPVSIHRYCQSLRRGQAARMWRERDLFDALIEWKYVRCRKGLITYKDADYSSDELIALWNEYSKLPGKNPPLMVGIKRTRPFSDSLSCKDSDENVFDIEMVEADKRRFGQISWKAHEFARFDESIREEILKKKRTKASGTLQATKQENLNAIEQGRGNPYAGAVGSSVIKAKQNGSASREDELNERQRIAYGQSPSSPRKQPDTDNAPTEAPGEDELAVAAREAENAYRNLDRP